MNSNIPWYADSTEELKARASRIIGNSAPSEISLPIPVLPFHSNPITNYSFDNSLTQAPPDQNKLKKRKSKKDSKSQPTNKKLLHSGRNGNTHNCFQHQQHFPEYSSVRVVPPVALSNQNLVLSIPKSLTDFELYAVLFQQGMNMGSADAVAQKLRQRCISDVVISSASSDFLGKVIESTLRVTVGWEAYVEYTSYFFQFVPDGIFSLKSTQTITNDEHGEDLVVVRSIYTFTGSLVNTTPALVDEIANTSVNSLGKDIEVENNILTDEETIASGNNDVKRACLDLETNILREELMLSSGIVENISTVHGNIFQEDGLPELNASEEIDLFQSSDFLQDLVLTSSESAATHDDSISITSNSDISRDHSWEKLTVDIADDRERQHSELSSTGTKKSFILKPKHIPKVQNELAHNVIADKELDITERFLLDEFERKVVVSPSTITKGADEIDATNCIGVSQVSNASTSTSNGVPAVASSVITSIDVIGAFNVYLNRQMQVEKLEFVYRNRCDT